MGSNRRGTRCQPSSGAGAIWGRRWFRRRPHPQAIEAQGLAAALRRLQHQGSVAKRAPGPACGETLVSPRAPGRASTHSDDPANGAYGPKRVVRTESGQNASRYVATSIREHSHVRSWERRQPALPLRSTAPGQSGEKSSISRRTTRHLLRNGEQADVNDHGAPMLRRLQYRPEAD